jgi:hypothetical protein
VIGQRRQHEVVGMQHVPGEAVVGPRGEVHLEHTADQQFGELPAAQFLEHLPYRLGQARTEQPRRADPVEDEGAAFGDGEGFREQFGEVVHVHALVAEHLGERVVLFLGPLGPQHVIEQQLGGVTRGEPGQFQAWTVHDDLAELADLGLNAERHTCEHYAKPIRCQPAAALSSTDHRPTGIPRGLPVHHL